MTAFERSDITMRRFAYAAAFFTIVHAIGWSRSGESGWFMPKPEGWN